jgi:cell division protein ZapA
MAQVLVTVNGRAFELSCADGEEPRIRRLAQYVDSKIGDFVKMHGQIGEARLMLLAALVIADELSDSNEMIQSDRSRSRTAGVESSAAMVNGIRGIAQRIESIAARLETS